MRLICKLLGLQSICKQNARVCICKTVGDKIKCCQQQMSGSKLDPYNFKERLEVTLAVYVFNMVGHINEHVYTLEIRNSPFFASTSVIIFLHSHYYSLNKCLQCYVATD